MDDERCRSQLSNAWKMCQCDMGGYSAGAMQFSKKDLDELKAIHLEQYGYEIGEAEAQEIGSRLVRLLRLISKPAPNEAKG